MRSLQVQSWLIIFKLVHLKMIYRVFTFSMYSCRTVKEFFFSFLIVYRRSRVCYYSLLKLVRYSRLRSFSYLNLCLHSFLDFMAVSV